MTETDTGGPANIDGLIAALRNLPAFEGTVFRGASAPPASEFVLTGPLPTSADPRIATENFSTPIVIAILTTTGRDIGSLSRYPQEREVVILPGTGLKVAARNAAGNLIVMEERGASGPHPRIDQVLSEITVALETARAADAAAITSPAKYSR